MISFSFYVNQFLFHWWKFSVGCRENKRGKDVDEERRRNSKKFSKSAAAGKVKYKRFAIKILIWFEEQRKGSHVHEGHWTTFIRSPMKIFVTFSSLKFVRFCQQAIMKYNQFPNPPTSFHSTTFEQVCNITWIEGEIQTALTQSICLLR